MTQDFAKIRPEPLLERKQVAAPPSWSLMLTGGLVGLVIGVFASFLFYLSGNVPPLANTPPPAVVASVTEAEPVAEEAPPEQVNFEFYTALPDYEVQVDAIPVPLGRSDRPRIDSHVNDTQAANIQAANSAATISVVLQSGAFQQQELATAEMQRQRGLGLDVRVKRESSLPGRTLFLVQSGPYTSQSALSEAEQILRRSNIQSLRTTPR